MITNGIFNKINYSVIVRLFFSVLLIMQIIYFFKVMVFISQDRCVTSFYDDDASFHIGIVKKTELYKSNAWYVYGPFTYRMAKVLSGFIPLSFVEKNSLSSSIESRYHLSLVLTNIISLFTLCFFVSLSLGLSDIGTFLASFSIMLSAFSSNEIWAKFFLRPYPDPLLCGVVGCGFFFFMRYPGFFISKTSFDIDTKKILQSVVLQGCIWGIALSIKMTAFPVVIAILGVLFFFGKGLRKEIFISFCLSVILTYLFVGFPQSLELLPVFNSLKNIKYTYVSSFFDFSYSIPYMFSFMKEFISQFIKPFLVIILISMFFPLRQTIGLNFVYVKRTLSGLMIIFIWILFFLYQPTFAPFYHYPMVIVSGAVVVCCYIIPVICEPIKKYIFVFLKRDLKKIVLF